jgi:dTDP-glucose 4,6-dehydratase
MLNPTNPYSATKAAADMLVMAYHKTYKIPTIILRCENNYGTRQHKQKLIPTLIKQALNGESLKLYGDGKHRRMWLHVLDYCRAIETVINYGDIGEIYNVGGDDEHENIEVANMVLEALGKSNPISYIDDSKIRPFHDRAYALNTDKIRSLGWRPARELTTSIQEVVDWYVNHNEALR